MKSSTYGHSWHGLGKGLNPAVLSALHMSRPYAGLHRYKHAAWVVDYAVNMWTAA